MAIKKIKVRMKVSISSAKPEFSYQVGQVVYLDMEQAKQWVAVGHAEHVNVDEPLTETAAVGAYSYYDPRLYARMRGTRLM